LSFAPSSLFVELIVGSVGFVLLIYGKKQQRWPQAVAGLLLMIYPYFVDDWLTMTGIGAAICAALWWTVRAGY
jgi:hypothetical protein